MKKTGAWLARRALENVGVRHTFGVPGVHVTELYDELNTSSLITPVLVTHEGGGAFMADAISRTSDSIGTLVIVPAAGLTQAMSGIGEAFLDGVPMLVIVGGTRRDSGRHYQLHQLDQQRLLEPLTKGQFLVTEHDQVVPTIYQAYRLAVSGEPGPVLVEIPVEVQLFRGPVQSVPEFDGGLSHPQLEPATIQAAVDAISESKHPGIFAGWGAREAGAELIQLAERLGAPVATSLQGLSVFPANHPLHVGMSFGQAAVPASEHAFKNCDCLIAVGVRFGEIATASFGLDVPPNLIHIDINPDVFHKNYPAAVAICGDAAQVLAALLERQPSSAAASTRSKLEAEIAADKQAYRETWMAHDSGDRVNPARFFDSLRAALDDQAMMVADDGNHTFLAAELFPVLNSRAFISPTDFNCMGYAVPAAIGVKLVHADRDVVAVVGDGAFLMTCMELVTAAQLGIGAVIFVFNDGELSQISQSQQIPYNRKTCTVLKGIDDAGVAQAVGASFVAIDRDTDLDSGIQRALELGRKGAPVIVAVNVDYSKRTRFTQGIVKTNLNRFPLGEKIRFVTRAIGRKILG